MKNIKIETDCGFRIVEIEGPYDDGTTFLNIIDAPSCGFHISTYMSEQQLIELRDAINKILNDYEEE